MASSIFRPRDGNHGDQSMQTLKVTGMTCGGCVASVKRALAELAAGTPVEIDLAKGEVTIADQIDRKRAVAAIEDAGYDVVQ
jgi:copper chaperone